MPDFTSEQLDLERSMSEMGVQRYWSQVATARANGRATDTPAVRHLMRSCVEDVAVEVRSWMKRARAGKGGAGHQVVELLAGFSAELVSVIAIRYILDMVARQSTLTSCAYGVGAALEEEAKNRAISKREPKVWADLKKRLKRSKKATRRAMVKDVSTKLELDFAAWRKRDKIQLGVWLIETVAKTTGLIEISMVSRYPRRWSHPVVVATQKALDWIEKSNEAHAALFPFWLPMVDQPEDWINPWEGGYKTNLVVRRPVVKTDDRRLLVEMEDAQCGDVLGAVNALQRVPWRINRYTYDVALSFWQAGIDIADLGTREDEPQPPRPVPDGPDGTLTEETRKAWRSECGARWKRVCSARSNRIQVAKIMHLASMFKQTPMFYYPHQVDWRGRAYPVPFFLQPQGPDLARGLLEFAEPSSLEAPEARWWWMIHGANCFGADKLPLRERMRWVEANHDKILSTAGNPMEDRWWATADKPWQFLAWAFEYYTRATVGLDRTRVPIALDGSNNGLQIFSLLMRDEVAAEATNCTPSESPRDIYQDVADVVTAKLMESKDPMAATWLEFVGGKVPRAATKRPVMTLPYGSTRHACIHYTMDWYTELVKKRGVRPFERGYKPAVFLSRLIWDAIGAKVGAARVCMDWLREIASIHAKLNLPVRWTAPSGFIVKQSYPKTSMSFVRTSVGDRVRTTRVHTDSDEMERKSMMNGIAPNFVHSLDAAALTAIVLKCRDEGILSIATVHDSFAVGAGEAGKLSRIIRQVYAEMFSHDLLERFRDEVVMYLPQGVEVPPVPERGDLDVSRLLRSPYFFA